MRKCACGTKVKAGDINAVFVYDRKGNLTRVSCGHCSAFRKPKFKEKKKKPWGQFFSPNGVFCPDDEETI